MYLDECGIKVAFSFSSDIFIGISVVSRITSVVLSSCPFVLLSSCHPILLSSCHLVILSSCHLVILSSCHLVNLSSCHLVILSSCHLVILSSCHLVILSSCHIVLLPSCHPVLLSSCQLVNLWAFFFWYFAWHFDRLLALICSSEIWRERKMHPTTFSRNPKTFSWKHAGRENRIPHFPGKKCICLSPLCYFCYCCWSEKVKTKHRAHICHNRWLLYFLQASILFSQPPQPMVFFYKPVYFLPQRTRKGLLQIPRKGLLLAKFIQRI